MSGRKASLLALRALLLGSTPNKLMHITDVPVLVVRGPEARGR